MPGPEQSANYKFWEACPSIRCPLLCAMRQPVFDVPYILRLVSHYYHNGFKKQIPDTRAKALGQVWLCYCLVWGLL